MALSQDVRRQLYGDEDDRTFFDWIRTELRAVEKKLEDGRAVLHHLEMFLVNVACNDPGAAIGANLVLPLLQDRLDAKALDYAAQQAAAAEEAIIKMEVCLPSLKTDISSSCTSVNSSKRFLCKLKLAKHTSEGCSLHYFDNTIQTCLILKAY